jgi:DNA gyrase subunit A
VRGVMLDADDYLVSCVTNEADTMMLVVSEKGLGKRTAFSEYRMTNRGTKGVITMNVTEKTGKLVAALAVNETDELMLMTSKGQSVRIRVGGEKGIRETGRNAQGVKLMDLREGEIIQDVALVAAEEDVVDAPAEAEAEVTTEAPASEGSTTPETPTAE